MPHRRSAQAARRAIQDTALAMFVARGYEGTSLDEVATRLSLTRQAVLYHFGSKEDLLRSIITPGLEALRATVDGFVVSDPPTRAQRRKALTALVNTMATHRGTVAVLVRFTNETDVAQIVPALIQLNRKTALLLGGSAIDDDPVALVRVTATMGALSGIMGNARLSVPLTSDDERQALVDGCLAMLQGSR